MNIFCLFTLLLCLAQPISAEEHGESGGGGSSNSGGEGGGEEKKSKGEEKEAPGFITVGPFIVGIIKNDQAVGYLKLSVKVHTKDQAYEETLKNMGPRLRSEYIINLSSVLSNIWITGLKPDLKNIKEILQLITNRTLGNDKVEAVLVENFYFTEQEAPRLSKTG